MTAVHPPRPGRVVLACRCGRVLDTDDMHTHGAGCYGNGDPKLGRIVCAKCAKPERTTVPPTPTPSPPTTPPGPPKRAAAAANLTYLGDGMYAEPVPGKFAVVRAACPRCPWRGTREIAAATSGYRAQLSDAVHQHTCTADQETQP